MADNQDILDKRKMLAQMLMGQAMNQPQGGGYLGALSSVLSGGLAGALAGKNGIDKKNLFASALMGK